MVFLKAIWKGRELTLTAYVRTNYVELGSEIWNLDSHGALRWFKRQKIPQRWKVAFWEGIDEYIHPPKFQKLAIGGF